MGGDGGEGYQWEVISPTKSGPCRNLALGREGRLQRLSAVGVLVTVC